MKFGKHVTAVGIALVTLALITGCGSNKKSGLTLAVSGDEKRSQVQTDKYLPKKQVNTETGDELVYQPQPNPYLKQEGQLSPETVQWFIQAKRNLQNGQDKIAEQFLDKITKKNDSLSGPWVMKGDIAVNQKKLETAVEHYVKAIEVNSRNVNAYLKLAKAQRELGRFVHAQNTYAKTLSVWKDFPEAHFNLGVLYDLYLNQPEKAQLHLEAYQFLAANKPAKLKAWLADLSERTGQNNYIEVDFNAKREAVLAKLEAEKGESEPNAKDKQSALNKTNEEQSTR